MKNKTVDIFNNCAFTFYCEKCKKSENVILQSDLDKKSFFISDIC